MWVLWRAWEHYPSISTGSAGLRYAHHAVGLPSGPLGAGEGARGHALDGMGEWDSQGLRSGQDGAVEGTHTGWQAFPQGASPHPRRRFSRSWFIRGPNPPRSLARGSLTDGGEGGAPNLGPSGPALCCLNPSPPRSLALPAPFLPLSSLTGLQGPADVRRAGLSRYLAAALLSKGRVSVAFCCYWILASWRGLGVFWEQRVRFRKEEAGRGVARC